jgi:hypothetical protein
MLSSRDNMLSGCVSNGDVRNMIETMAFAVGKMMIAIVYRLSIAVIVFVIRCGWIVKIGWFGFRSNIEGA